MIEIEQCIEAFVALGKRIRGLLDTNKDIPFTEARRHNSWFTEQFIEQSLNAIVQEFLQEEKLRFWLKNYDLAGNSQKSVGIVCAGNLPLVSFHDILSVLISGHHAQIKLSSKDAVLVTWILDLLVDVQPDFKGSISITERLNNFNAVLATGSNNSARYFEYYFRKVPHIIRKNRTGVAVLDGNENKDHLHQLGHDVFDYFGLGCRNVSKIFIPYNYPLEEFKNLWNDYKWIMDHNAYRNNLDYYRTVYLMTNVPMVDIDFVNMVEKKDDFHAPIANLYYEFYENIQDLEQLLRNSSDQLQCICSNNKLFDSIPLGTAQSPGLMDYADGIDVMSFLNDL